MDDKDKNFKENLLNNLDQQREEMAAGAQIEDIEEQRMAQYQQMMNANNTENAAELAAGSEVERKLNARKPMTEAEAKALLMEETRKTEKKLEKAHKSNRKLVIMVIVVAAVLCVAGVALALILGGKKDEEIPKVETPVTEEVEEPEEEPEDEVVALGLDDEVVQKLYGNFANVGKAYSSTLDFYTDNKVQRGDIDKVMMLDIALGNSATRGNDCRAEHYIESGMESYEVGELFGCRDGAEARGKIQEIFGTAIELNDGDTTGEYCGAWKYDAQNDEFYVPSLGCGGACLYELTRELFKAEQDKNNIYLYETVYGGTCQSMTRADGTVITELEVDENGSLVGSLDATKYADQFDQFKWTFTKNDSREYIFTGLEKIK